MVLQQGPAERQGPLGRYHLRGRRQQGYVYLDGAELAGSRFAGDLRNQIDYPYYDWISYGFYDFNDFQGSTYWGSTRPSFWVKRQKGEARHSVWSKLQVYNVDYNHFGVYENVIKESDAPNYWFLSQTTPSRDFRVEKIHIRNDVALYGGIFYIRPVMAPDIQLDLVQSQYSGGKPLAHYGNGAPWASGRTTAASTRPGCSSRTPTTASTPSRSPSPTWWART